MRQKPYQCRLTLNHGKHDDVIKVLEDVPVWTRARYIADAVRFYHTHYWNGLPAPPGPAMPADKGAGLADDAVVPKDEFDVTKVFSFQ